NWSILEAQAERILFTDGDCIPHACFVQNHFLEGKDDTVCCGRRVDIMERIAANLTVEDICNGKLDSYFWILSNIANKRIEFGEQGLYFPGWIADFISLF